MLATRTIPENSIIAKKRRLLEKIHRQSLLKDKEYLLASGERSNYYFDMKQTTHDPEGISLVADVLVDYLRPLEFKYIGGLATGAIAVMVAVCMRSWGERDVKGFFVRDIAKDHGTKKLIDGFITDGASVIIVDDVTTKGDSAMKAVRAVQDRGCKIVRVVSLVDRLEGARENFANHAIDFDSIFTTRDFD
jgi:orotate phosphoribosyltransferase